MQSQPVVPSTFLPYRPEPRPQYAFCISGDARRWCPGRNRLNSSGFSLVDLVVVLVVVGLLVGMLLPSLHGGMGRSHSQTHCMSNQRQIVLAMMVYQIDNDYTSWGDGPMDIPGGGSATRAFVR